MNKKFILLLFLGMFLIGIVSAVTISTNLTSYYSFSAGNTLTDMVAGKSNLTTTGTPINNATFGLIGNGWSSFSSGSYVGNKTSNPFKIGTTAFSSNIWVRFTSLAGGMQVFGSVNTVPNGWGVNVQNAPGVGPLNVHFAGGSVLSKDIPVINRWYMITLVRNSTGGFLYVNGTLQNFDAGSGSLDLSGSDIDFKLGGGPNVGYILAPLDGRLDEFGLWVNRSLSTTEITQLYNSGSGLPYPFAAGNGTVIVSLVSPANGATTVKTALNFSSSFATSDMSSLTNTTLELYNSSGSRINTNYSVVNNALNATNLTFSNIANGNYSWNQFTCGLNVTGTTVCSYAPSNFTFTKNALTENSQTFNNLTTVGNLEPFSVNVTYDNLFYTSVSAYLYYNGTPYLGSQSGTDMPTTFSKSLIVPLAVGNYSFYWTFLLANSSGTTYINSTINSQTVSSFYIDNCSTFTTKFMNLKIQDEDTLTPINGTIEVAVNFYSFGTKNLIGTYNNSMKYDSNNSISLCLGNITGNYTLSYQMRYFGNSSYYSQFKEIQTMTINSALIPQNITLYDLPIASGYPFSISVRGADDNSNLLVDVQRQYIPTNNFLSVESSVTDYSGAMTAHLVQGTAIYNFIVSKDGIVLGTFNNYQVKCDNLAIGSCFLTLNLASFVPDAADFTNYGGISYIYLLDNSTRNLYLTYVSQDGNVHTITQNVIQNDGYGNNTICTNTVSGTSGTIICNVPLSYGDVSFVSEVIVDGNLVGSTLTGMGQSSTSLFYGVRTILMLLLYSSLVLLFIANPIMIVIGSMFGMMLGIALLLVDSGSTLSLGMSIAWFVIAGGIVIWQIARRV